MLSTTEFATTVLSKCVCGNHLKRCKSSNLWLLDLLLGVCLRKIISTCRVQERHRKSPANADTYHWRWYQTWPVWRTCTVVITCCSRPASIQFYFAISACEWQPAKPRTGKTSVLHFFNFRCHSAATTFLHGFRNLIVSTFFWLFQPHWLWRW